MDFLPYFRSARAARSVHHFKDFRLIDRAFAPLVGCLIKQFTLLCLVHHDRRRPQRRLARHYDLPVPEELRQEPAAQEFRALFERLMNDFKVNSEIRRRRDGVEYQEFCPAPSKPILDEIDGALAGYNGLEAEDLDHVVNYDVKFRMGSESDD